MGMPSIRDELQPENNQYKNPFGTEIAMFRTSEGGMARMGVSWDTPGYGGEVGRVRGQKGSMIGTNYQGQEKQLPSLAKPPLPPEVNAGGHGGSHGYLGNEFVMSIVENRKPLGRRACPPDRPGRAKIVTPCRTRLTHTDKHPGGPYRTHQKSPTRGAFVTCSRARQPLHFPVSGNPRRLVGAPYTPRPTPRVPAS